MLQFFPDEALSMKVHAQCLAIVCEALSQIEEKRSSYVSAYTQQI